MQYNISGVSTVLAVRVYVVTTLFLILPMIWFWRPLLDWYSSSMIIFRNITCTTWAELLIGPHTKLRPHPLKAFDRFPLDRDRTRASRCCSAVAVDNVTVWHLHIEFRARKCKGFDWIILVHISPACRGAVWLYAAVLQPHHLYWLLNAMITESEAVVWLIWAAHVSDTIYLNHHCKIDFSQINQFLVLT